MPEKEGKHERKAHIRLPLSRHFVLSVLMIAACRIGPAAAGAANTSPVVELTEPDPDRAFIAPADISLAAFCYDAEDNHNVVVEFFEGTHSLGFGMPGASGCGTAPGCYSYLVWSNAPPGDYILTAKATDTAGATTISRPVHITVFDGPPPPGSKLWRFWSGGPYGSAAVAQDGTIYVPEGDAVVSLYALTPGGYEKREWYLGGGGSSAAIGADGTIYEARGDGISTFRAYSPAGPDLWSVPLVGAQTPGLGLNPAALAPDGTIYTGGEYADKGFYAFRPDGTLKWKFVPNGLFLFPPVVGSDGTTYFGVSNDGLYGVNPDGAQRFHLAMTGYIIWLAVGGDGTIYVVGSMLPTKLSAFTPGGRKKWETPIGPDASRYASAPVIGPDGALFVVSDRIYAFNPDGSSRWCFPPPTNAPQTIFLPAFSPAAVDSQGNVYAGVGGQFLAVSADGTQLWSLPIETRLAPTLTRDGTIYVTGDALYAIRANAGLADSPWPLFRRDPRHSAAADPIAVTNNLPVVNIVARDAFASEGTNFWSAYPEAATWANGIWNTWGVNIGGTNTATFVVRREGPTNQDLIVEYEISGTASSGVDYAALSGAVTVPTGKRSARIVVVPTDDTPIEGVETVVLSLKASPDYFIGLPSHAAAIIIDNNQPRPPCMLLPDHEFHLCNNVTNGFSFRIEASTDLKYWVTLCWNIVTDGALHFVDPDAAQFRSRFYRIAAEAGPDD